MNKYKIKSGALQFAIYTASIVALLLFGLILYLHTYNTFNQKTNVNFENVKAGNTCFLRTIKDSLSFDTILYNDFKDKNQNVKSISSFWGAFQKTTIFSNNKNKIFKKNGLVGATFSKKKRTSLYLKDNMYPLSLVGNTRIIGNSIVPKGIKSGFINNQGYNGNQFIYGNYTISNQKLPSIDKNFLNYISSFSKFRTNENNINSQYLLEDSHNSFYSDSIIIYKETPIVLNKKITGNFLILSKSVIIVKSTSDISDVILSAPKVIIENKVKGNFHIISSENIEVQKNVELDYPSSLMIISNEEQLENKNIFIDEYSIVKGVLLFKSNKNIINNFKTNIKLNKNAKVLGEIYCDGNLELLGNVFGSVYTNQFVLNMDGTLYLNHLFDTIINSENFPKYYCGILFENNPKSVAKWLY